MNGTVPGLLPAGMAHHINTAHAPGVVDVLDIPGKGKCQVFIARQVQSVLLLLSVECFCPIRPLRTMDMYLESTVKCGMSFAHLEYD